MAPLLKLLGINKSIFDNIIFKEKLEVLTLRECMRQLFTAEPVNIPNDHGMTESQLEEFIIMSSEIEENQQRRFYTALTNIRTNNVTIEDEELYSHLWKHNSFIF